MKSLKGHLLVATTELLDPNFARTVVLMFEHTELGAAGVVINRPIEASITDIAEQVFEQPMDWDKPIYLGGPVPGPLMVIHVDPVMADQEILPGVYSTIEAEKVRELLRQKTEPTLIVANYAGWGAGQLERELAEETWEFTAANDDHLFGADPETLWDVVRDQISAGNLLDLLGVTNVPDDPSQN